MWIVLDDPGLPAPCGVCMSCASICVCLCVCVHACVYSCCSCVPACVYGCMHTCIGIPVHAHMHLCVISFFIYFKCIFFFLFFPALCAISYLVSALCAYVSLDSICILPYVSMFVHTKHRHTCICIHLCMYTCESCIHKSVYRCACMSVCGHAYWIPLGMKLCFEGAITVIPQSNVPRSYI